MNGCALSKTILLVLINFFVIIAVLAYFFWFDFNFAGLGPGSTAKEITLSNASYDSSKNEFTFTLDSPAINSTKIISVTVNQTTCISNFLPVNANAFTPESCLVKNVTFSKGETIEYVIELANGQSISGETQAQ